MRKKEKYSSIFDAAAKMHKKKEKEEAEEEAIGTFDESIDTDAKYQECETKYKEIKEALEKAFEKAGVNPHKLHQYLDDPTHFSNKEWQQIEEGKKELEKTMPTRARKEEEKPKKKKKKKKDALSKKRWLPMK